MRPLAALLFAALLTACASGGPQPAGPAPTAPVTAWIVSAQGTAIGQATFTESANGVLIHLEFLEHALSPGWHGLHLHQRGDCSDFAEGFRASGGHIGMSERIQHGLLNPGGPEAGDLPSIFAAPNGPFGAEAFAPRLTLGAARIPGNANRHERLPLLDEDGAALLIHAGPDDQRSQPIGGAGARVACAAIRPLP